MAITDAPAAADTAPTLDPRRWWMLGVLCLSLLIVFVGNSSLNVTIPTLLRDLHASASQLQWVVARLRSRQPPCLPVAPDVCRPNKRRFARLRAWRAFGNRRCLTTA